MTPTIFPVLRYADAPTAMDWLCRALDFEQQLSFPGPDGTVAHAELRHGAGVIGISSATPAVASNPWSSVRQGVYVVVDDVDAHHARAVTAGARIAIAPYDTSYGSREYSAWDAEGELWGFGTYQMGAPTGEPTLIPEIRYKGGEQTQQWLTHAFGFTTIRRVQGTDGAPIHVEMRLADSPIMLNLDPMSAQSDGMRQAIGMRVKDLDAALAQAVAHGAAVIQSPTALHYGARCCWVRDIESFVWGLSDYKPE